MASHEVRTPLTTIRGFAMMLNRHWPEMGDREITRALEALERQSNRLWDAVQNVLTTSQIEVEEIHTRVQPIHLASLLRRSTEAAGLDAQMVTVDCDAELWAMADASSLARVVQALVDNAALHGTAPYALVATRDQQDIVLRVHDAGPGVPDWFQDQLFDAFSQANNSSTREVGGIGLGLRVARHLARANGGDVWYETPITQGAMFCVRMPRCSDPLDAAIT
jgi:K+-sensing histidine kinase KdpD